jgi:Terpene cyclase DEP1
VKTFYAIAAVIGAIAPYAVYFGYLGWVPGTSGALSLAWGSPIAAATLADFTIACIVFWPFVFAESKRLNMRYPLFFVVTNILVGLSFALPAFLYARERALADARTR